MFTFLWPLAPLGDKPSAKGMAMWDEVLDCEGLLCPLPVLKARKRLMAMQAGQVLCLRATDAMARIDLPHFCAEAGHSYLGAEDDGPVTLHLIRAGG
jgi:tRNA 2-thiouridine synthesizing protein A